MHRGFVMAKSEEGRGPQDLSRRHSPVITGPKKPGRSRNSQLAGHGCLTANLPWSHVGWCAEDSDALSMSVSGVSTSAQRDGFYTALASLER
jgi:hypothetical protein